MLKNDERYKLAKKNVCGWRERILTLVKNEEAPHSNSNDEDSNHDYYPSGDEEGDGRASNSTHSIGNDGGDDTSGDESSGHHTHGNGGRCYNGMSSNVDDHDCKDNDSEGGHEYDYIKSVSNEEIDKVDKESTSIDDM